MRELQVDFHNHLMPGADDGAQDRSEASEGLAAMLRDGVSEIVAGVHVDASLVGSPRFAARLQAIDEAFAELGSLVAAHHPSLGLHRGAEVNLDTPHPDFSDPRLRLAGTRFALVEFPALQVVPFGAEVLARIAASGWRPVLAHPERYRGARNLIEQAASWVDAGALLQLNHGSIAGRYGAGPLHAAEELLEAGMISYLSSDYHCRGGTWIPESLAALEGYENGSELVDVLLENGRDLLRGVEPRAIRARRKRGGVMERFRRVVRGTRID